MNVYIFLILLSWIFVFAWVWPSQIRELRDNFSDAKLTSVKFTLEFVTRGNALVSLVAIFMANS